MEMTGFEGKATVRGMLCAVRFASGQLTINSGSLSCDDAKAMVELLEGETARADRPTHEERSASSNGAEFHTTEVVDELKARIEKYKLQLAVCAGPTKDDTETFLTKDDSGWTPIYQAICDFRSSRDEALEKARLAEARASNLEKDLAAKTPAAGTTTIDMDDIDLEVVRGTIQIRYGLQRRLVSPEFSRVIADMIKSAKAEIAVTPPAENVEIVDKESVQAVAAPTEAPPAEVDGDWVSGEPGQKKINKLDFADPPQALINFKRMREVLKYLEENYGVMIGDIDQQYDVVSKLRGAGKVPSLSRINADDLRVRIQSANASQGA